MADPNDWWNSTRPMSPEWYAAPQRTEPPQQNILARAMAGIQDMPANVWGSLTPEVQRSWGSLANALAELSPGASVRDMVNSSGDLTRNVMAGNTWGSLGAGAGLLTAMAGLVPGTRAVGKAAAGLPMDQASRINRMIEGEFSKNLPPQLYHGTNRELKGGGFSLLPPSRATSAQAAEMGVWVAEHPEVANSFADLAAEKGGRPMVYPLVARASKRAAIDLDKYPMNDYEVAATLQHLWDQGYDAARFLNYTLEDGGKKYNTWVFKDPSQLRSPFAAFDPAKKMSSDLLAGGAGLVGAGVLGYNALAPQWPGDER